MRKAPTKSIILIGYFICLIAFLSGCMTPHPTTSSSYDQAQRAYAQRDYARAFETIWIPAKRGEPWAQYALGYMYYYGIGTNKDLDIGLNYIRKAADKGYVPAIQALKQLTTERHNQYVTFEKY